MKYTELVEANVLAFLEIKGNKMRSLLAALGVMIGISTVILMGWLLQGLNDVVQSTFDTIGVDMLYIDKWAWAGGENWDEIKNRKDITENNYREFLNYPCSAEVIAPYISNWGAKVKHNKEEYFLPIIGTIADYSKTSSGNIEKGRFFNLQEEKSASKVIVLGNKAFYTLFPDSSGVNKQIKIDGIEFTIIGYTKKQGTALFDMMDNQCFIPLKAFKSLYGDNNATYTIAVKAGSKEKMDLVRDEIRGIMRIVRNIQANGSEDFSINESAAFSKSFDQIKSTVAIAGIGITLLSFIVGIIGIMNIMFVSVTERTKEIGIRKAVGAKRSSIIVQFIVESASLCLLGAMIAYVFCSAIVFAAATYLPNFVEELNFLKPYLSISLLLIAAAVSIFVGILAGIIPAFRAAKLDPVDALRFE